MLVSTMSATLSVGESECALCECVEAVTVVEVVELVLCVDIVARAGPALVVNRICFPSLTSTCNIFEWP